MMSRISLMKKKCTKQRIAGTVLQADPKKLELIYGTKTQD